MTWNTGDPLDIKNALPRNAPLFPAENSALVHAKLLTHRLKALACFDPTLTKSAVVAHGAETLHIVQLFVKPSVACRFNDIDCERCKKLRMTQHPAIHSGKTPHRNHFIPEWAEKRGLTKADIARATGADKGLVSRWFNQRIIPGERYLAILAEVLHAEEPAALFRHPDEDWLSRFFAGRSDEERQRMIQTLEAAFPRKRA